MITLKFDTERNYWVLATPSATVAENLETLKMLNAFAKTAPAESGMIVHSGFRLTPVKITFAAGYDPTVLNNDVVTFET